jgi:hypothetical protein
MEQGALLAIRRTSQLKEDFRGDGKRNHSLVVTITPESQRDIEDRTPIEVVMHDYHVAHPVQRYNELLTRLYPWDVYGIEVGADPHFYFDVKAKLNDARAELFECIEDAKKHDVFIELLKVGRFLDHNMELFNSTSCGSQLQLVSQYFQMQTEDGKHSITSEQARMVLAKITERLTTRLDPYRYSLDAIVGTSEMKRLKYQDGVSQLASVKALSTQHFIAEDLRSTNNPVTVATTNWCIIHEARIEARTSYDKALKFLNKAAANFKKRKSPRKTRQTQK